MNIDHLILYTSPEAPPRVDRPQSEQLQADAKRRMTGLRESQRDMLERRIATLAVVAAVVVLALAFLL